MADRHFTIPFTDVELATEEWRIVPGYEGAYSVSNLGRIRTEGRGRGRVPGRILRAGRHPGGYRMVALSINCAPTSLLVHRVVMLAFAGPCPTSHEVNHVDGNKANNRLANLEYTTPKQNIAHARDVTGALKTGDESFARTHPHRIARGERAGGAILTADAVRAIRAEYATGCVLQRELAARFGVKHATISAVVLGKVWRHI